MKLLFKIFGYFCLIILVLFIIGLLILSALGGNSEWWQRQVEQVASEVSGQDVVIGTFHDARLFPDLLFEGENITLAPRLDPAGQAPPLPGMFIKKLEFSVPYWSVFIGAPAIEHFYLEEGHIIGPDHASFRRAFIETTPPQLKIEGAYADTAYTLHLQMKKVWGGYMFEHGLPFIATMKDVQMSGHIALDENTVNLKDLIFQLPEGELTGLFQGHKDQSFKLELKNDDKPFLIIKPQEDEMANEAEVLRLNALDDAKTLRIMTLFCTLTPHHSYILNYEDQPDETLSCLQEDAVTNPRPDQETGNAGE